MAFWPPVAVSQKLQRRSGVYCIINSIDGRAYIGSSARDIRRRWYEHRRELRMKIHRNAHLQSAWTKFGEDVFEFLVLEECAPSRCLGLEQKFIDDFGALTREWGYNLSPKADRPMGTKGYRHSAETRSRISAAMRAGAGGTGEKRVKRLRDYTCSPETRAKLSAAGKKNWRPEYINRLPSRKGVAHSAETKMKISESGKVAQRARSERLKSSQYRG